MLRLRTVLILVFAATTASGQGPSAAWRTVTTPHFRVHYPAAYEAWATRAASRLESERKAGASETGYTPGQTTDVLVMNPFAEANGITLTLLDSPRIILYTEPPPAESQKEARMVTAECSAVGSPRNHCGGRGNRGNVFVGARSRGSARQG